MTKEKVVRNGKVAVLYSPGFGAGWFTWNRDYPQLLTHPRLVEAVETGKRDELEEERVKELLGLPDTAHLYCGGADQLEIGWLDEGEDYYIDEYDGSESIIRRADGEIWRKA